MKMKLTPFDVTRYLVDKESVYEFMMAELEEAGALMLEPREVYDPAFIGVCRRAGGMTVAAYNTAKCISQLELHNEWDRETAAEWFEFNTASAWVGEGTPVFIDT